MTNNERVNSFMTFTKFEDLKQTKPESLLVNNNNKKRNKLKNNNNNNNNKIKYNPYKEACLYDERKESVGPDLIKISTPSSLSDTHCYEFMDSTNFTNEPSSFIPCFVHSIQPKQQQDQAVIISPTEHHCKEFTQIPRLVTLSSASAAAASENTVKNLNHNNHHNNNHSERKGSSIMDRHDLPSPLENDISSHDILFPRGKESKDETVRLASAAADRKASQHLAEAEFNDAFHSNKYKRNTMNKPETPISPTPYTCPSTTTTTSSEDELESLDVPLWSDANKHNTNNNNNNNNHSIKRKSVVSIDDSSWGDTEGSSVTSSSRIPYHIHNWNPPPSSVSSSSTALSRERPSKNILKMIHQIQADRLVKRELVGQLEKSENQYTKMRVNYESRLDQFKQQFLKIQKQRDHLVAIHNNKKNTALAKPTVATAARSNAILHPARQKAAAQSPLQLRENKQEQEIRCQYEVKLKQLTTENQELRKKYDGTIQSLETDRNKAEDKVRQLSSDMERLELDKKSLNKVIKQQTDKARETVNRFQRQIEQLKRRENKTLEAKNKLEEIRQQQSELLKKRTEETAAANSELRQLKNTLRRSATEGVLLNHVSLDKIMTGKIPRRRAKD